MGPKTEHGPGAGDILWADDLIPCQEAAATQRRYHLQYHSCWPLRQGKNSLKSQLTPHACVLQQGWVLV